MGFNICKPHFLVYKSTIFKMLELPDELKLNSSLIMKMFHTIPHINFKFEILDQNYQFMEGDYFEVSLIRYIKKKLTY